jgi:hypothetical protein
LVKELQASLLDRRGEADVYFRGKKKGSKKSVDFTRFTMGALTFKNTEVSLRTNRFNIQQFYMVLVLL